MAKESKRKSNTWFLAALAFFVLFVLFTVLVKVVDVQPIGPNGSKVGFAGINGKIFEALGTSEFWYTFSERLGYTALLVCGAFALIGVVQFIKGKGFKGVDSQIVLLGIFYVIVVIFYVAFDKVAINFRPVLEADGTLEASYPSSHTVLAVCVFATMFMQKIFNTRGTKGEKTENVIAATVLTVLMLASRLLSGVHWFTDIVGAVLLSASLVCLYWAALQRGEGK